MLCGFLYSTTLSAQAGNVSEQYLLAAANHDRALHELPPVQLDGGLQAAALLHARKMAERRTISHQFPGEPDLASRAATAGVHFSLVTENVAEASNAALIHELWMQSAGHRANLLDSEVDSIGVAVVRLHGQLYAVEDFARSVRVLDLSAQEEAVAREIESAGVQVINDASAARATCALQTGYVGPLQPWFIMRYTAADLSRLPEELSLKLRSGRFHKAAVGACAASGRSSFSTYNLAVLLYP